MKKYKRWEKKSRIKLLRKGKENNIDDKFSITRAAIQLQRANKGSYQPPSCLSGGKRAESL
jgi:hypothetical protein